MFVGPRSWFLGVLLLLGVSGAVAQEQELKQAALRDFNATAALQNSGFYARAAEKWTAFLQKHPKDERIDRVHYYLGICQLHTKKYADAVKTFQTVLSSFPKFQMLDAAQYNLAMAQYQLAVAAEKPDSFKIAAASFAVVPAKYAQSRHAANALYFQGESLHAAGEPAAALEPYKKLIAAYPKSGLLPEALYALGVTQQELGSDAEAAATFQVFLNNQALAKHELASEIKLRLGMSLYNQAEYSKAEQQFAIVAALPEYPLADFAMLRQGQCRLEIEKPAEAVALFNQLLAKFPESGYRPAAQLAAGKCYFLTGQFPDAEKMLAAVASGDRPEAAEAAYWLGRTRLKNSNAQQALALLEQAVQRFPEGEFAPYLRLTRIDALYELPQRRQETPPLYEAFAKQFNDHPLTPQAVYMAGLSALHQEDYANARRHADAYLANAKFAEHELTPAVLYVAAEGYLLADQQQGRDVAKAEQLYRRLVAGHPEHSQAPRAHLRIGWCLYQAEKHNESVQYLGGALAKLADPAQQAEARFLIGRGHSAAGRDQESLGAYDAALAAQPDWPRADEVLVAAAQSHLALEDFAAAKQRLTQMTSKFPTSSFAAQAIYQLGEIEQEQKNYDAAVAHYRTVLQQHATSEFAAAADYGLASALFAKQDMNGSLAALNDLLAKFAQADVAPRGLYLRGLVHQRLKNFDPAAQDLQAFLKTQPEGDAGFDARYALGLCQVGLKQFAPATQTLAALLKDKPDYAYADKVYYEMAHALRQQDKSVEATQAFRDLIAKTPASPLVPEAWFHVGHFHEVAADNAAAADAVQAETAKAAEAFAAGLSKAEAAELREKLQYKLGDMQFRQEKFADAAATLLAQIQEHPQGELLGPARFLAAESFYRENKFDQALPLFVQVAVGKVEPYHAQSLYRAGDCAAKLKSWPPSQQHYAQLIQLFPKFELISEARYGLGLALQNQNQLPQARAVYEQVTRETETETAAKARFMIGEIAFAEKKYQEAIEHFLVVAAGYPYEDWQGLARFETGRCFIELKQKDEAIAALQIVVDKYSTHPKAKDAATLLAELKK